MITATLISLIVIVAIVAVAIWLIKKVPLPPDLEILRTLGIAAVVIVALLKVLAYL